jgi:hypothetical protein
MLLGTRNRPSSHLVSRGLLLLALLVASLTLIQCRQVGDSLTGVNADLFRRKDECTAQCQDQFKERNKVEDLLHAQNIAACGANPTCIAAENARHIAAQNQSKAIRDACLNACHQQGGGTVGQ